MTALRERVRAAITAPGTRFTRADAAIRAVLTEVEPYLFHAVDCRITQLNWPPCTCGFVKLRAAFAGKAKSK